MRRRMATPLDYARPMAPPPKSRAHRVGIALLCVLIVAALLALGYAMLEEYFGRGIVDGIS